MTSRFSLMPVNRMGHPIESKPCLITVDGLTHSRVNDLLKIGFHMTIRMTKTRIWLRMVDETGNWSRANPSGMSIPRKDAGGDELGDPLGLAIASLITANHRHYCTNGRQP